MRRGGTAGGAACRVGGAVEEAVVWEVTVKGGALGAGTKEGGSCSTTFPQSIVEMFAGKRTTYDD